MDFANWRQAMQIPQSNPYRAGLGMPTQNAQGGWSLPVPAPPSRPMTQTQAAVPSVPPMPQTPQMGSWETANGWWTPQGMRYPIPTLGYNGGSGFY